jgi:hypothetical protein
MSINLFSELYELEQSLIALINNISFYSWTQKYQTWKPDRMERTTLSVIP